MENFASYILNEPNYIQKMIIAYYMSKKTGIFFDKSIILRTQIGRMFLNYADLNVDKNQIITAILLCNCKKVDNPQKIGKLETYAKEGAEYLATLGFDKKFCKICEGLNRYVPAEPRVKESDILELVDQFTGLILRRAEREAFTPKEALIILKERNLKNLKNRYLEDFILFVNAMENIFIKDAVDVPVIRKLAFLAEREHDVKSYIAKLGNRYSEEIDRLMRVDIKKQAEELLYKNTLSTTKVYSGKKIADAKVKTHTKVNNDKAESNTMKSKVSKKVQEAKEVAKDTKNKIKTAHRYTRKIQRGNKERALFSKEAADRIMNHKSEYKIEA